MERENKYTPIVATAVIIIIVVAVGTFYIGKNSNNTQSQNKQTNPTIDVKSDTKVNATTVKVATFYNGQDGYSLSIPSGNKSTCIWNYEGGSADIPYMEITNANSATEKHTIIIYDNYNYRVNCFDDFGNQYVGVFPKQ
jgi:hypothetical protein